MRAPGRVCGRTPTTHPREAKAARRHASQGWERRGQGLPHPYPAGSPRLWRPGLESASAEQPYQLEIRSHSRPPPGCHQARGLLRCEHPRPGLKGPTRVQCPSCVRLQGGSTSARPSTVSVHRREPRLTNASSEQAENHCVFPEESKGLKECCQNTPSAVTQTPSWPLVACSKTKVRSTWAGHF